MMNNNEKLTKVGINWYPGHMAKTKKLIGEKINQIDVVYEVIDSRIPYSSKIKDIDTFIKNKKKLLIFSKYDLCDKNETNKWVQYYEKLGYKTVCIDPTTNISKIINATKELMEEQNKSRLEKELNVRKTRVLIVGIPNVGKSTLINKLVGKKAVSVGNKPGVTKSLDWIRINDQLELLDTPGILWPKIDDGEVGYNLASLTAIKEEILPREEVVCYILKKLYNEYPNILKDRYSITELDDDFINAFDTIGKKRGCLIKGGEVDYDRVCDVVLNDIKEGYIKNITFDKFSKRN